MDPAPHVNAQSFHGILGTGVNRPCIFRCEDSQNQELEYAVKFFGTVRFGLMFEYISWLIAKQLNIPIPNVAIVHIDQAMSAVINDQDVRRIISNDPGPHFGSELLIGGYVEYEVGMHLSDHMIKTAVEIFAFDMLIQNCDRAVGFPFGKPNLLTRGDEMFAIDHEKSFVCTDPIAGLSGEPWELRDLPTTQNHIFCQPLRQHAGKDGIIFKPFIERFMSIPEEFFPAMMDVVPLEWQNQSHSNRILAHFSKLRTNITRFERGLLEVFV